MEQQDQGTTRSELDDIASAAPAPLISCSYRQCKKTIKSSPDDAIVSECSTSGCTKTIHHACLTSLLESIGRTGVVDKPICGKRCCNALIKRTKEAAVEPALTKKRVACHDDGPTPSVSSMSCLIDWLTSNDNYSRYRGGSGQHGETKTSLAGEAVHYIAKCGVTTVRTPKDILTKISSLEHTYRAAADWLASTGSGVTDNADLSKGVLSRCPEYCELHPVMHERPSVRPLIINTAVLDSDDIVPSEAEIAGDESDVEDTDTSAITVSGNDSRQQNTIDQVTAIRSSECENSDSLSVTDSRAKISAPARSNDSSRKRPGSVPKSIAKSRRRSKTDYSGCDGLDKSVADLKAAQLAQEKEYQTMKLQYQHEQCKLQREELLLRQSRAADEAQEAVARKEEAEARAVKLREEAEKCALERRVILLRERKKLLGEDISPIDIDLLLPLAPCF